MRSLLAPYNLPHKTWTLEEKLHIESPIQISATDGYRLGASLYYSDALQVPQTVAIINCATGVKAAYYARYARFLAGHGYLAITYDYRGIGASRPPSLRRLKATKFDWGSKDFEGVMQWVITNFPDAKIVVIGHSIGGVLPGFSASNWCIDRMLTVGAQFAYWQDYAERARYKMLLKWHVLMPLATSLAGYFPGRLLGWLEDLPAGVAYEWAFRRSTLPAHDSGISAECAKHRHNSDVTRYFSQLHCPLLAYSITDDDFGTPAAVLRFALLPRQRQNPRGGCAGRIRVIRDRPFRIFPRPLQPELMAGIIDLVECGYGATASFRLLASRALAQWLISRVSRRRFLRRPATR